MYLSNAGLFELELFAEKKVPFAVCSPLYSLHLTYPPILIDQKWGSYLDPEDPSSHRVPRSSDKF